MASMRHTRDAEGVRAAARAPEAFSSAKSVPTSRHRKPLPIFPLGGIRHLVRLVVLILSMAAVTACADASATPALSHSFGSAEALVAAALNAMEAEDQEALEALLITREEYEALLWPEMPDGEYTPFDFVWSLTWTNNQKGVAQALSEYGGMPLEFVSVRFAEEPEVYQSFKLHPGVEVIARRADTGAQGTHPSFDVLIEYGGQWKLLNLDEL